MELRGVEVLELLVELAEIGVNVGYGGFDLCVDVGELLVEVGLLGGGEVTFLAFDDDAGLLGGLGLRCLDWCWRGWCGGRSRRRRLQGQKADEWQSRQTGREK